MTAAVEAGSPASPIRALPNIPTEDRKPPAAPDRNKSLQDACERIFAPLTTRTGIVYSTSAEQYAQAYSTRRGEEVRVASGLFAQLKKGSGQKRSLDRMINSPDEATFPRSSLAKRRAVIIEAHNVSPTQ